MTRTDTFSDAADLLFGVRTGQPPLAEIEPHFPDASGLELLAEA